MCDDRIIRRFAGAFILVSIGLAWLVISVLLNGALYAVLATIVHAVLRRAGPGRREP